MIWMDLEGIMPSEKVRERQIPYDLSYMWNLHTRIHTHTLKTKLIDNREWQLPGLWVGDGGK